MKHFGIYVGEPEKLSKDTCTQYFKQDRCQHTLPDVEYNYDKNMEYFSRLSVTEFHNELAKFLKNTKILKKYLI